VLLPPFKPTRYANTEFICFFRNFIGNEVKNKQTNKKQQQTKKQTNKQNKTKQKRKRKEIEDTDSLKEKRERTIVAMRGASQNYIDI